ncbi:MAG: S8 family serine peptidase, partial [Mycobacterium sp.]
MTTIVRLVGASALAIMPLWTAPAAVAVTPPVVDMSILPKPGSPAPPQRTEQQGQCVVTTDGAIESTSDDPVGPLRLQDVWPLTRGAGQTVAVIDTGVSRHRLLPHLVPGGDYVSSGDGTADCDGHGTIVAGIIGASPDPDNEFSGIAPEATIIGIRQSSNNFRAADDPSG